MSRADVQQEKPSSTDSNPMNRLVPYLDLYGRLSDEELARLAGVPASVAADLRRQVVQVDRALARFTDLLPRLTDAELVRLTGATPKTVRFWRLCQPRHPLSGSEAQSWSVAQAAEALGRVQSSAELARRSGHPGGHPSSSGHPSTTGHTTGTWHAAMSEDPPLESGAPLEPPPRQPARHPTGEMPSQPAHRMPAAERDAVSSVQRMPTADAGSSAYRMPAAEREAGRRVPEPSPSPSRAASELARPRSNRTEEVVAAPPAPPPRNPPPPPPPVAHKQQAVAQQMRFSGAPFPGHDYDDGSVPDDEEDDGIFIGLELPDPRMLSNPGRRE